MGENNQELETFGDGPYFDEDPNSTEVENEESTEGEDQGKQTEEEIDSEEEQREEIDPDSQVNNLETKVEGEKTSAEGTKTAKSEDEDPSENEGKDGDTEPDGYKPSGKTVKAFDGDQQFEIGADSEFRVKVDGKSMKVPLQELLNNYSGKVSYDKKFSEVDKNRKEFEQQFSKYNQEKEQLVSHLKNVGKLLDDPSKSPMDAFYYFLDMTGRDVLPYQKKVMTTLREELETLSMMDESELKAYWLEKENEALRKNYKTSSDQLQNRKAQEDMIAEVNQLRESFGVSEQAFVEGYDALVSLGHGDPSPQDVVQYASTLPLAIRAEKLITPYLDMMEQDDAVNLVRNLAKAFKDDPNLSDEHIQQALEQEFSVKVVKPLAKKVAPKVSESKSYERKGTGNSSQGYETWDD